MHIASFRTLALTLVLAGCASNAAPPAQEPTPVTSLAPAPTATQPAATDPTPSVATSAEPVAPAPEPADEGSSLVVTTGSSNGAFDKGAAMIALRGVSLASCNLGKEHGHVRVVFEPSGHVSVATVDSGSIVGTARADCVAGQYRKMVVPAFTGAPVTIGKSF